MFQFLRFLETRETYLHVPYCLFLILSPLTLLWCFKVRSKNKHLPPSPFKFPLIGNLHQLGKHPHRDLQSLSQKLGPLMLVHLGRHPTIVVSDADSAQEILKTHDMLFLSRSTTSICRKLMYGDKDLTLAPYGEQWRQMRSICVLQLLSSKRVQSFQSVREEEVGLMIKTIEQSCSSACAVDLSHMFASIVYDVVCKIGFGRKYGNEEIGRNHKEIMDEFAALLATIDIGEYIVGLWWLKYITGLDKRVDRVFRKIDKFLDKVVDDRLDLQRGIHDDVQMDFVDVLLKIQKSDDSSFSMSREYMKALLLDMFAAGTDTTYTALEWAMTELLRHPEIMKKTQKEIQEIVGSKTNITEHDLEKMHYLKSVIKEAFRLHPPVPLISRETTANIRLKSYNLSGKTRVLINVWAICRDPASWNEPEKFNPERFVGSSTDFKGHDFGFIPFGSGRRGCPGSTFAVAIIELVLANLLHKFNWELPGGISGKDLDISEVTGVTVHRKFPLVVIPIPHNSSIS